MPSKLAGSERFVNDFWPIKDNYFKQLDCSGIRMSIVLMYLRHWVA
jgi:hypothetical protein